MNTFSENVPIFVKIFIKKSRIRKIRFAQKLSHIVKHRNHRLHVWVTQSREVLTSCVQVLPRGVAETQVLPVQLHPASSPHQYHRALRLPHPGRVRGEGDAVNSENIFCQQ